MSVNNLLTSPEGKTLEFKRDLSSPKPILKTLVAFANTAGGRLLVGIAGDGVIVGIEDVLSIVQETPVKTPENSGAWQDLLSDVNVGVLFEAAYNGRWVHAKN